jgi:hypothetical protein
VWTAETTAYWTGSLCCLYRSDIFTQDATYTTYTIAIHDTTERNKKIYRTFNITCTWVITHITYTGMGQNNGNTTDTVHISLLIWRWTAFFLQYSRNLSWNGLVLVLNSL